MTAAMPYAGRWWHMEDGRMRCDLCPRDCLLNDGQRGACFVRQRVGEQMILTTYGRSSGFCVDPIEKKPLNHFYPGSAVFSFGTAGCNLACRFCQNWDISKSRDFDRLADQASPEEIADTAKRLGCRSVAFTYNDPVIFAEYAMDVADACHAQGIQTVAVTAGYIHDQPRREFFAKMDAANVDLKAFTEVFYHKLCVAHLEPVLDTLRYLAHSDVWLEVTNLIIPTHNDGDDEIRRMADWMLENLGADVPVHYSAFHPDYRMTDLPSTPGKTLANARRIALDAGLHHVYTGNIHDPEGDTTFCPHCNGRVIERNWYEIEHYRLTETGNCPTCGTKIAGRFGHYTEPFGRQRIPVTMHGAD